MNFACSMIRPIHPRLEDLIAEIASSTKIRMNIERVKILKIYNHYRVKKWFKNYNIINWMKLCWEQILKLSSLKQYQEKRKKRKSREETKAKMKMRKTRLRPRQPCKDSPKAWTRKPETRKDKKS